MTDHDLLSDVEIRNGAPIALSRFGWKKIHIDGKTYLLAATREELVEAAKRSGYDGDLDALGEGCPTDNFKNCVKKLPTCKKKYCLYRSFDTGIGTCVCTDESP